MADKNKVSVYLNEQNIKLLDCIAAREDLSRSKVLDKLLTKHFKGGK